MIDTLSALDSIQVPGTIRHLPYRWSDSDEWKQSVMRGESSGSHSDSRIERTDQVQYQHVEDRELADATLAAGGCATCYFPI